MYISVCLAATNERIRSDIQNIKDEDKDKSVDDRIFDCVKHWQTSGPDFVDFIQRADHGDIFLKKP